MDRTPWQRVCEARKSLVLELRAAQDDAAPARDGAAALAAVGVAGAILAAPAVLRIGVGLVAAAGVNDAAPRCAGAVAALRLASLERRLRFNRHVRDLASAVAEMSDDARSDSFVLNDLADEHAVHVNLFALLAISNAAPARPELRGDAMAKAYGAAESSELQRLAGTGSVATCEAAGALGVLRLHLTEGNHVAQRGALEDLVQRFRELGVGRIRKDSELIKLLGKHFPIMLRHELDAAKDSPLQGMRERLNDPNVHNISDLLTGIMQSEKELRKIDQVLKQAQLISTYARTIVKRNSSFNDVAVVENAKKAFSPPPLSRMLKAAADVTLEAAADAALALCDAFVFARVGVWNMRACGVLHVISSKAERKMLSLAAVAAHERWSCAALQEVPGKPEDLKVFQDLLRRQKAFARWDVAAGKCDPSWQNEEAPVFIFDKRCWEVVKDTQGVAVDMLGRGESERAAAAAAAVGAGTVAAAGAAAAAVGAATAGAFAADAAMAGGMAAAARLEGADAAAAAGATVGEDAATDAAAAEGDGSDSEGNDTVVMDFVRRPGLLFLRSTATARQGKGCYLALVSVHARPKKSGSNPCDDAKVLSGAVTDWVNARALELQVAKESYVCVIAGDHNIGPLRGCKPDPGDAFKNLIGEDKDFMHVPFVDATGAVISAPATNVPEFSARRAQGSRSYDHAFISKGIPRASAGASTGGSPGGYVSPSLSGELEATARVCDVAAAPFSRVADELEALDAPFAAVARAPCEPLVRAEWDVIRGRIKELRKVARLDHYATFSDHKPLTITLLEPALPTRAPVGVAAAAAGGGGGGRDEGEDSGAGGAAGGNRVPADTSGAAGGGSSDVV
jgi:hypothetical protein